MKDGFEKSLELIHEIYQLKEKFHDEYTREERKIIIDLRKLLIKTQFEVGSILGRKVPWEKMHRFNQLSMMDPFDRTEEEEKEFRELRGDLKVQVHIKLNSLMSVVPSLPDENPFIPNFSSFPDFINEIFSIRIDPLKIVFNIWHKALKRNKYSNIKLLEEKLNEYREKTMGTDKEYLFKKWDGLDKDFEFESLRKKSLYGLNPFYEDLVDFIHKKSFIEKMLPKKYL